MRREKQEQWKEVWTGCQDTQLSLLGSSKLCELNRGIGDGGLSLSFLSTSAPAQPSVLLLISQHSSVYPRT